MCSAGRLGMKFDSGRNSKMRLLRQSYRYLQWPSDSTSTFGQGLPSIKVLTFDLAHSMAQAAMAKCHADGHKIAVVVVDSLDEAPRGVKGRRCGSGGHRSRDDESENGDSVQNLRRVRRTHGRTTAESTHGGSGHMEYCRRRTDHVGSTQLGRSQSPAVTAREMMPPAPTRESQRSPTNLSRRCLRRCAGS